MTITSIFRKNYFLFIIVMLICYSCNENDNKPPETNTMSGENTESGIAPPASFSGQLDTLWVDSAKFASLPNAKLIFAFIFEDSITETLHGWSEKPSKPTGFDTLPDIKLNRGRQSTLVYGRGTYFGNVVLKEVNQIKNLLNHNKAKYVVFAPKLFYNHIEYSIHLSNEDPRKQRASFALIPTEFDANPSPPKKY